MSSEWKEYKLKYKYTEIPETAPYRKKKKKKAPKKANHKHQYAECIFDYGITPWYGVGTYCTICGRIGSIDIGGNLIIPEDKPVFKVNLLDKYIALEGTSKD